jgi:hypothetical protein
MAEKVAPRMTNASHKSIKSYFHHQCGLSGLKAVPTLFSIQLGRAVGAPFHGKARGAWRVRFSGLFF